MYDQIASQSVHGSNNFTTIILQNFSVLLDYTSTQRDLQISLYAIDNELCFAGYLYQVYVFIFFFSRYFIVYQICVLLVL